MPGSEDSPLESSKDTALRRQLEGGLEVLETASSRYRELSATLLARRWRQRLRRDPTLLETTLAEEPALPEVLNKLQRRAAQEPKGPAGLAGEFLRQFEEERARLWRAMALRLSLNEETLSLSGGTLAERLVRLKAAALEPLPVVVAEAEVLLPSETGELRMLEGRGLLQPLGAALGLVTPFLVLALLVLTEYPEWRWRALALFGIVWGLFHVRSGQYWLTSERLVWKPRWSRAVQVPLSSIGEGNLRVSSWNTVKVSSAGGFSLCHVPRAYELAALLSIRRREEFRGAAVARDPRRLIALLSVSPWVPGVPDEEESLEWGVAVLRPGFVAFFSRDLPGELLLDAITEPSEPSGKASRRSRDRIKISLNLLLEQLQLLPEERMDAMLRKAASFETGKPSRQPRAFLWEARELKWGRPGSAWLELSRGDTVMRAHFSWRDTVVVEQLLEKWTRDRG